MLIKDFKKRIQNIDNHLYVEVAKRVPSGGRQMSRQIKFRAWDKRDKRYLNNAQNIWINNTCFGDLLASPNFEIEQYTGLKDAYGEEIYEGDVVHGYDQEPDRDDGYIGSSVIEVVNFKWGSFWLGDFNNRIMLYTPPIIEVIGNVHENPELLEAQHD